MFRLRLMGIGLALLGLAGCSLLPTTELNVDSSWEREAVPDEKDLNDLVRFYPITSEVLKPQLEIAPDVSDELAIAEEKYEYRIGVGDVLQVVVWDHPQLTMPAGSMRSAAEAGNWVHSDGTIFYPYVGKIKVAGLRVPELREILAKRLATYVQSPQVDVSVAAFRSQKVYVTGEVKQPGTVPITNVPMRVLDAINAAGGALATADWSEVVLTRGGKDYRISLRAIYQQGNTKHNVLLKAGDVLHLNPNTDSKVFVLGEVKSQRVVPMGRSGLTLAEALASGGGMIADNANASGVFVMRANTQDPEKPLSVYQLNARSAMALVLADQFQLKPRDVVYVTTAPLARWNRVVRNIVPTFQTLYYGSRAINETQDIDDE